MTRVVRGVLVVVALVSWFLTAPTLAAAQGIGVGVKGGFLHTTFDSTQALDNGNGWMAGLFFGGNRPGTVGFMGELNFLSKNSDTGNGTSKIYYFQVPALLRVNIGSGSTNLRSGIVYGVVGPALDLKLGDDLSELGTINDIESVDVSIVAGVGFEVSRFIVEGRGAWGQRNIAAQEGLAEVKATTFAILAGIRFN